MDKELNATNLVYHMNRRKVLSTFGASAALSTFTGCKRVSSTLFGCNSMHNTQIDYGAVSLTDEQVSNIFPLVYTELQSKHQRIIDAARRSDHYEVCPPVPEATKSFVDLVQQRIGRQLENYSESSEDWPTYIEHAYLKRDRQHFELHIAEGDMQVS